MDDLLADFLTETKESLVALDAALVKLERTPQDAPTLSEVFRQVHTIKGTCGFLGLSRLERVTHVAENLLGRWRDGTLAVTPPGITAILGSLDAVRAIVAGLENDGNEPAGDDADVIARLDRILKGEEEPEGAPSPSLAAIAEIADITEIAEAEEELPAALAEPALPIVSAPESPPPAVVAAAESQALTTTGQPAAAAAASGQTIRVSVDVLEDLMMLVSELVLTRNQLIQLARSQGDGAISVALQRLSHITSDLQDGVMKTRMQPIANAWAKLPRLVRDLGHELGKRIELRMRGEETELDRQVLELIKDPLTHMVRNSADHALEEPAARKAAGKPEFGTISLNAYHEGGQIIIEVGDDGRGLNTERIRAKAISQGLATEAELAALSERDIHRFIFRAGFSTAAVVTAVSGRGVGMDVVKTNVERIGGTVDVRSREGVGTTFTIRIPLTLAIVSALIVEAGQERFAIPQIGVLELVSVGGGGEGAPVLEWIKDAPVLRLRDQLLPVVSLGRMLELMQPEDAHAAAFVVVMSVGGRVFGLLVDRVFDTEEIVVKPVAPILRSLTVFSGNTILGDGSVIMILDPNGVARAAGLGAEGGDDGTSKAASLADQRSTERTALLLFRAGDGAPKAVPLGLVSRLEDIPSERIERSGDHAVVQYRGQLMPLIAMDGSWLPREGQTRQAVLVFNEDDRFMGLAVDEILDVVEERLDLSSTTAPTAGFLGSAVISGKVTDLLDAAYWLRQSGGDWFHRAAKHEAARKPHILVVEDSGFFRSLIVPSIAAAGYDVTAVENGSRALGLRDQGVMFDAIVSDIEMPELDGIALARNLRQSGPWRDLPIIALSSHADPDDVERGRGAGFTDYVQKYDREALIASIRDSLAAPGGAAWESAHDADV